MGFLMSYVILCLFIGITTARNLTQESIGFPESEENVDLSNKDNRKPVYIPAMCPVNELFYPGDQKDDWICDCRPAFLYHPRSDSCWPAYRTGPCESGQYLVLPENSVIPVCAKNPCFNDTYVTYNGRCEKLGTIAPCKQLWPIPAILAVDATKLMVTCEKLSLESRFGEATSGAVKTDQCLPGCKRSINGKRGPPPSS